MNPCGPRRARWLALLPALLFAGEPVWAQYEAPPPTPPPQQTAAQARPAFSQQELDQMLAPIALYPDSLLSQILMASTYPLEVVEAARWSRAHPELKGEEAARAVQAQDWDPSVKSLVAFPQVLQRMDEDLDWTERLGDAFLGQQQQVMATIQELRSKAYAAGNLRSSDQQVVEQQGQTIVIVPANPQVVYVPYYDPTLIYGTWWWPAYPPIYWPPYPGYVVVAPGPVFIWGVGFFVGAGFFFGAFDWGVGTVNIVNVNNFFFNPPPFEHREHRRPGPGPGVWHFDPDHRRGVPFRDVDMQRRYGRGPASPEARRSFRGYEPIQPGERERGGAPGPRGAEGARPGAPETRGPGGAPSGAPEMRGGERRQPEGRGPGGAPETRGGGERRQPEMRGPGGAPETRGGGEIRQPEIRQPEMRQPRFEGRPPSVAPLAPIVRPPAPIVRPPAPQPMPPAFEGIGRGPSVREFSSRGHESFQRPSAPPPMRAPAAAPMQRPSGGPPPGGAGGGGHSGPRGR